MALPTFANYVNLLWTLFERFVQSQSARAHRGESTEMLGITPPLPVPRPAYQGTRLSRCIGEILYVRVPHSAIRGTLSSAMRCSL